MLFESKIRKLKIFSSKENKMIEKELPKEEGHWFFCDKCLGDIHDSEDTCPQCGSIKGIKKKFSQNYM